ncbi:RagB/SusD family nutrient uptake outer membrane protein [Chitinophaga rhizophila]|uniref:RagB/SusD family nutrient uptake outer membrane protein n=1 Tax=Chitinophaga rhizophila TaxID=2866212 RepID=A0ABS7GB63_9BACT|nr:RagB/SusD family nutrient uptake outer membrane protein [Chitinophaga rhizophila]MBW8684571.1 RagB/SusD family nutrient uptake outer membrane protein [Chitinophaga rhizophila]
MKKVFLILTAAVSLGISSCNKYLDQVPDDVLTVDDIFKSKDNTDYFLANVYFSLPNELQQRFTGNQNSGAWYAASDESKYNWSFNYTNNMNTGAWASTDGTAAVYWNNYYKAIRNASVLIQNIDNANPIEVNEGLKKQYKAEARALRAIFYFFLVRIYGPAIMLGENPIDINASVDELKLKRSHIDTCVNYIVTELDKAAADLDAKVPSEQYGRITSGVAKAYKVQALMLAASPLWNGNTDYADFKNTDGEMLVNTSYDPQKWVRAAAAAKEFLDIYVPSQYDLYTASGADAFTAAYNACRQVVTVEWNKEWIYGRANSGSYLRYDRTPFHAGSPANQRGAGANGATQAMVDAYFTANGRSISDPASGYVASGFSSFRAPFDNAARNTYNQWVNREPRFYAGITYNNSYWLFQEGSTPIITNMEFNGNSGRSQSTSDVSPTGYIVRKDVFTNDNARGVVLLRLANIFLDYAEALNESAPGNADIMKYVNLIRNRAGIPQYGTGEGMIPEPTTQEAVREAIRAERRVELAFESSRYFDTRRWKIAKTTNNGPVYGMNMMGNGAEFYQRTLIENRIFTDKDYLFPIPNTQILINPNLVQNPGWK